MYQTERSEPHKNQSSTTTTSSTMNYPSNIRFLPFIAAFFTMAITTPVAAQDVCKPAHEAEARNVIEILSRDGVQRVRFEETAVFVAPDLWRSAGYED